MVHSGALTRRILGESFLDAGGTQYKNQRNRLDWLDGSDRLRSTSLLLVGSTLGFLGFLFAALLGCYHLLKEAPRDNYLGQTMIEPYFPATVSEMVSDTRSPSGKCFFAFVLIGAICMLTSWYPWQLRNCYIGDEVILGRGWFGKNIVGRDVGIKVLMMRAILPPVGIMMVACIPAPPAANREFTDMVACTLHTLGATVSIGGYAFIELYTLLCAGLSVEFNWHPPGKERRIPEKTARLIIVALCLFSIFCFLLFSFLQSHAGKFGICCEDVWAVPDISVGTQNVSAHEIGLEIAGDLANSTNTKLLKQTASGTYLIFKLGEYWFEVLSGLFMLASHLVIWYYCPERYLNISDAMPDRPFYG